MAASYLVTGGAGFIGSHLAQALLDRGHAVRVLDDLSTRRENNLTPMLGQVEFIRGDVRDLATVRSAVDGVEVVFHHAALASVPRSISDPLTTLTVNVTGTEHVLEAARDAGVRRVVYASSSSVYGDTPMLPKSEHMPAHPLSPYAVHKLAGELLAETFTRVYGLETVGLRYFNVFGPRQDPASPYAAVIPRFIAALLGGHRPVVFGDGEQTRDFTYVANVVEANLLAGDAPEAVGQVMNIGSGERVSLNALLRILSGLVGASIEPEYRAPRPGDVHDSLADTRLAQQLLGYQPAITLQEGLAWTVDALSSEAVHAASYATQC